MYVSEMRAEKADNSPYLDARPQLPKQQLNFGSGRFGSTAVLATHQRMICGILLIIVPSIVKELVASESVTLPLWSDRMSPVTFVELLVDVASVTVGFFVLSSVVMSSCSIMGRRRWQETNKEMHFKFRGHSQDKFASWLMIFRRLRNAEQGRRALT